MEKIKELINQKVDTKIKDLAILRYFGNVGYVRYEGGRLFYETETLKNQLANFDLEIQVYYLNQLKEQIEQREIIIRDNCRGSATDITKQFINWIETVLIDLKIKSYSIQGNQPQNPEPENKYLNIFKEGGYKLFIYFNEHYTRHNHQLPTKYSNIYRFLEYEQFIVCTQEQYKDFIKNEVGIKNYSKVTKGNYTYEEDIFKIGLTSFGTKNIKPIIL